MDSRIANGIRALELMESNSRFDALRRMNGNHPGAPEWFVKLMSALTDAAGRAKHHLYRGIEEEDISYVAWASRMLLEVQVWGRYCTQSLENAESFARDYYRDATGLAGALAAVIREGGYFHEELEESLRNIAGMMRAQRFEDLSVRYTDVGKIAETFPDIQFAPFNKILSKAVHPTAYMVQTDSPNLVGDNMLPAMAICGLAAGMGYYRDIEQYVSKVGL
jgi:hypothetical protein